MNYTNITGNNNTVFQGINNSSINIGNDLSVQQLVAKSRLKEALDKVSNIGNQDTVILLKGRLARLERSVMLGTIDSRDENLERNNIVQAILSLCNENQEEDYSTTYQQPKIEQMNKYQNLSKSDVANVLLTYLQGINPTNRPKIETLQAEIKLAQNELQYSKLQTSLEELARASVSPNVNNFQDFVFKTQYDNWITSAIEMLTKYINVIDKHSSKNETSSIALSRLNHTKTMENLALWVESLKRNCGSRVKLSDKLVDKLDYWKHYVKGLDEEEIEIVIDNQIIDDFQIYCTKEQI